MVDRLVEAHEEAVARGGDDGVGGRPGLRALFRYSARATDAPTRANAIIATSCSLIPECYRKT